MPEPKGHIVKPFGLIGGDYEVDGAGLFKYLLACVLAVLIVGTMLARRWLDIPHWVDIVLGAGFAGIVALCVDVVRKGRKL